MPRSNRTPAWYRAVEILGDKGEWFDYYPLRDEVSLHIPPGKAKRNWENNNLRYLRIKYGYTSNEEIPQELVEKQRAKKPLDRQIATGRKQIATQLLTGERFVIDRKGVRDTRMWKIRSRTPEELEEARQRQLAKMVSGRDSWAKWDRENPGVQRRERAAQSWQTRLNNLRAQGIQDPEAYVRDLLREASRKRPPGGGTRAYEARLRNLREQGVENPEEYVREQLRRASHKRKSTIAAREREAEQERKEEGNA